MKIICFAIVIVLAIGACNPPQSTTGPSSDTTATSTQDTSVSTQRDTMPRDTSMRN